MHTYSCILKFYMYEVFITGKKICKVKKAIKLKSQRFRTGNNRSRNPILLYIDVMILLSIICIEFFNWTPVLFVVRTDSAQGVSCYNPLVTFTLILPLGLISYTTAFPRLTIKLLIFSCFFSTVFSPKHLSYSSQFCYCSHFSDKATKV